MTNWRATIGRRAIAVARAYFGDESIFESPNEIEEQAKWLLPSPQDVSERGGTDAEAVSVEEIVCRQKAKFTGAPFLWENGLTGVASNEQV